MKEITLAAVAMQQLGSTIKGLESAVSEFYTAGKKSGLFKAFARQNKTRSMIARLKK
jgi:hypothetical protein